MSSLLALVDRFATSAPNRALASAVIAGALMAVAWGAWRIRTRTRDRIGDRTADVVLSGGVLAAVVAAGTALLRVWRASSELGDVVADIETRGWLLAAQGVLTVVVLFAVYLLTRLVKRGLYELADSDRSISKHQVEVAFRTGQVVLYTFTLIVLLSVWGVNLGGLLVGAGFLGIVVGMAARQTLGALLAGFVLMFSRPFEIGDWVQIDDKAGIVTDITIVNTRLQTVDGEYVMLPNDLVASNEVVNRSRKGRLRVTVDVGVDYAADVERAMDVAREALRDIDVVLSVPQPQVVAKSFGDSAVVLGLRVWIDKPSARRLWRARTAVVREVKTAFDEAGVKIPYPQRELSGRAETGGFEVAGPAVDTEGTENGEAEEGTAADVEGGEEVAEAGDGDDD